MLPYPVAWSVLSRDVVSHPVPCPLPPCVVCVALRVTIRLCPVSRSVPCRCPGRALTTRAIRHQVWDTLQAFASNITGALATRALLGGMGVGDAEATPLAATITWLLKVRRGDRLHSVVMVIGTIYSW